MSRNSPFTIFQDAMLTMLAAKNLTPVYQYVKEEGGAENRMYTVTCTVNTLVVQVIV